MYANSDLRTLKEAHDERVCTSVESRLSFIENASVKFALATNKLGEG